MALKNNKTLGQHWLYNRRILDEIAELAAEPLVASDEAEVFAMPDRAELAASGGADLTEKAAQLPLCLEIGPGLGTLTSSLFKHFKKVVAVEYDERLAANLPGSFPGKNLEVVNGDILEYDFGGLGPCYRVAGNIPYYITKPIIKKILSADNLAERAVLLVQKEVAEKVVATHGKHSPLSLWVEMRAKAELGPVVKADEFTPPPEVDSQVLILDPLPADDENRIDDDTGLCRLIEKGFKNPRKKLVNNLPEVSFETLAALGLDPNVRAEKLTLKEWCILNNSLHLGSSAT